MHILFAHVVFSPSVLDTVQVKLNLLLFHWYRTIGRKVFLFTFYRYAPLNGSASATYFERMAYIEDKFYE